MNRIITYLTAGLLFCFTHLNAQTVVFTAGDVSGNPGEQVCIPIKVTNFTNVLAFTFSLSFDPSVLQFTTHQGLNLPPVFSIAKPGEGQIPANKIGISWYNDPPVSGLSRPDGTTLFEVCFTILQSPGVASTPITFTNSPTNFEVFDPDLQPKQFSSQPATVSINGISGPLPFKLSIPDKTADPNTQVCVDVTAQGFTDIISWQFHLRYDPAKLQFASVGNFNASLPGLNDQSITAPGEGVVQPGRIVCGWDSSTGAAVTIPTGATLFQVCFNVIGTGGTTTISFSDDQLPYEVRESDGTILPFNFKNGIITINGDGGGGGNSDEFKLSITDKSAETGTQVCVDVTAQGFTDIISWQFHLRYDPAKLQFASVGNFNASLPGLNDQSITTPGEGVVQPGRIVCGWDSSNGLGATVNDGAVLFQVCFNVLAANGTATISFSDDQLPYEVRESDGTILPFMFKNGTITISNGGGGGGTFKLSLSDKTVQSGQQVCVDVMVDNMVQILGFSFTVSYNPSMLTFVSTQGLTLPDQVIFGLPNAPQPTTPGIITVAWTEAGLQPVTRPNGSVVFQLCFTATGSNGTTTTITFADTPTDIEVADKDGEQLPFNLKNGTVTIGQAILSLPQPTVTNVGCFGTSTGAVDLQPQGGSGNFTYTWSNGATTQDLTNIPAGTYGVTVTDTGNSQTATGSYNVTQPASALAVTPTVKNVDCVSTNTGSISLAVNGGTGPYLYNWSGSLPDNVSSQNNLPVGQYGVTVTDSKGCTLSNSFEVGAPSPIVLTPTATAATAGLSNGAIALTVGGGQPGYTYAWSNGATTANISNLAKGEYCVTVTDTKGCTQNGCFMVPEQSVPLSYGNVQIKDVTCSGGNDGTLTFKIQGGRAPYTVVFTGGATVQSADGNVSRSNLASGPIIFTITDGAGVSITGSEMILAPAPIQITSTTVVHDTEESGCTGRITIALSGGDPNYLVQWNAPNTGTGNQIINLCEGTFVPTVRDGKGCTQTFPGVVVNTFKVAGQVTNAKCPQDADGKVKLNISGGAMPYTYSWRNANGEVVSTADSLVNVAPGVYTARVTEQSGNVLVRQFTIGSTSNLTANVEVISDYNGFDVSCPNAADGIIEATGISGNGSYTFQWKRGTTVLSNTSPVLNGASVGAYEVIVTDGIGCTVSKQIVVMPPDTIEISANIRDVSCPGSKDGEIIVSALGGAVGKPYSFAWGNAATGPRISFLAPGTYTVTATDANNCTVTNAFTLAEPKPVQVNVETQAASDGCNGSATAIVEGGTAPYTFQWNSFPNQNKQTITDLCPGTYFVNVTDSRGCSSQMTRALVDDDRYPCIETSVIMTPNSDGGDGLNDIFRINCIENFPDNHLEIYNRSGQLVFETDNYDNTWRGTKQSGDLLPGGPYYYVIEFTDVDGKLVQRKGSLTILRD
ncbi:MAG: gliding motility-associated C-terminal domain-containing protein [Saprospiraceae bacterium]|nr:gliding motility-associated C-terminal domain-containing protein [Saprospiraceae bacterium]